MEDKKILVIGSMNMDLILETDKFPVKGETVLGNDFNKVPGGKGANQAMAATKLGAEVDFIGACGQDIFGDDLLKNMEKEGLSTANIFREDTSTGIAAIFIEKDGDNRIIAIQGANKLLSPEKISIKENMVSQADIILLQLEIPLETVCKVIDMANSEATIILDPAPVTKLPEELFKKIDYILPNEIELGQLLADYDCQNEEEAVNKLLKLGVKKVIVTKGKEGVFYRTETASKKYQAYQVKAVDTTAAGDAFAGALATGLQKGWHDEKIIRFAMAVAALSVSKLGAQSSLPSLLKVKDFLARNS